MKKNVLFFVLLFAQSFCFGNIFNPIKRFATEHRTATAFISLLAASEIIMFKVAQMDNPKKSFVDVMKDDLGYHKLVLIDCWKFSIPALSVMGLLLNEAERGTLAKLFFKK